MVNILRSTLVFLIFTGFAGYAQSYEKVVSLGYQTHDGTWETGDEDFDGQDYNDTGYHLGFRLYNEIHPKHKLGVGLDFEKILSERLTGYRALDYQYLFSDKIHGGAFFGAASIDTGLPQNGYYYGINASLFVLTNKLALHYEFKIGDGLARDSLLESDPQGERPDIFLDFTSHTFAIRWSF